MNPVGSDITAALGTLSAMVMPAVLISASSMLVLSTSARLARVVDRVRALAADLETHSTEAPSEIGALRWQEVERQLGLQTRRGRLIQRALTSFYIGLSIFVGTTMSIAGVSYLGYAIWLPGVLALLGTLALFYGCMLLIGETGLALRSVDLEMEFALKLRGRYAQRK